MELILQVKIQSADPHNKLKMCAMSAHPPGPPVINVELALGGSFALANIISIREGGPEMAKQH